MKKTIFIFLLGTLTIFTSCSENENSDTNLECIKNMSKYSDIVSAKAFKYNMEAMSTENCLAYKKVLEDYISITKDFANNLAIIET